ncbi:hypothetical protein WJX81_006419 [Elliptochloris bilobata]|uniref:EF-hand domain-containing protein n=1 Tax=Elliptochloris bilobata TaxID=381761 RepID=A0AAW1RJ32_9CHLO
MRGDGDVQMRKLHVDISRSADPEHRNAKNALLTADTPHPAARAGSFSDSGHAQSRFPCSKLKLDNLFLQWLSLPESQKLVLGLLEEARNGRAISGPAVERAGSSPLSPSSANALFANANTPPLSPHKCKAPHSPVSPSRRSGSLPLHKQARGAAAIPRFYFPGGRPVPEEVLAAAAARVDALLAVYSGGLTIPGMKQLVKEVCELPCVLAYPLFYKLITPGETTVSHGAVRTWLAQRQITQAEPVVRMYEILRKEECQWVAQADLKSMLAGILLSHPGLEFLQETPEFQDRYAETVIFRIFYHLDRSGMGRLTLRDLKRGDLLAALRQLDEEEDVNKVLRYFSYEHFYVIYCKWWELDSDHDFLVSKNDLLRYGNHSLTYRIVERIFTQAARPFVSKVEGKMGYEDFVWFILSEEDKTNDVSLEYWFRCLDLDCDGCLRANEMLYFYEEQLHRMECLSQEPVLFEDVLCQMHDMLAPAREGVFTLRDLKKHRSLAGTLFNILFNLNKFIAFETRDPFLVRQEREDAGLSDWDRFARAEYVRLALEEEGDAEDGDTKILDEPWDSHSLEAPF